MPSAKSQRLIVKMALAEDSAGNDLTTQLAIKLGQKTKAVVIANQPGLLCGIELTRQVFKQLDKTIVFKPLVKDGMPFKPGQKIALIKGKAKPILSGERVALNFLAQLSGIATLTNQLVKKIKGSRAKIMDTRKTTPNLRALEKYAVRTGGGYSHRLCLAKGIIVKDNHLKAGRYFTKRKLNPKKIGQLIRRLRRKTALAIEIEVENIAELREIMCYHPDVVMLDNFSLNDIETAVKLRNKYFPQIKLDASGGITLANVAAVARTGVDLISVGRITHSPQAIDFSLDIIA